jgi:long-chain acyl-CoA synthetase
MDPKETYLSKPWLKHYPKDVPGEVDIPEISVTALFDRMADRYANKPALIFYGKKITYKELKESANRFAAALADLGVTKGETVALYLLNCPQYVIAYLGALKAGAKVTPISPVYTSKEVRHQLEDSEAKTVICEDILYDNVEKAQVDLKKVILTNIGDYLPALKRVFGRGAMTKAYGGMHVPTAQEIEQRGLILFRDLLKKYPPDPPRFP